VRYQAAGRQKQIRERGEDMTREEIIRLARDAGFDAHDMSSDFTCNLQDIERLAALVAAAERQALKEEQQRCYVAK
jgi:hypothetical protein